MLRKNSFISYAFWAFLKHSILGRFAWPRYKQRRSLSYTSEHLVSHGVRIYDPSNLWYLKGHGTGLRHCSTTDQLGDLEYFTYIFRNLNFSCIKKISFHSTQLYPYLIFWSLILCNESFKIILLFYIINCDILKEIQLISTLLCHIGGVLTL